MGSMRIGDETVEWPDADDATIADALAKGSHVPGDTPTEIIANWPKHEAASYREIVKGWLADKVYDNAVGTVMEDAQAAKDQAEIDLDSEVTIKPVAALPK